MQILRLTVFPLTHLTDPSVHPLKIGANVLITAPRGQMSAFSLRTTQSSGQITGSSSAREIKLSSMTKSASRFKTSVSWLPQCPIMTLIFQKQKNMWSVEVFKCYFQKFNHHHELNSTFQAVRKSGALNNTSFGFPLSVSLKSINRAASVCSQTKIHVLLFSIIQLHPVCHDETLGLPWTVLQMFQVPKEQNPTCSILVILSLYFSATSRKAFSFILRSITTWSKSTEQIFVISWWCQQNLISTKATKFSEMQWKLKWVVC